MRGTVAAIRGRTTIRAGILLVLALALGGCMLPPEPATTQADATYGLYILVFSMAVAVFVLVEGFILYSVIRYRRRDDRLPEQLHGNNLVEVIWTVIPTIIVLIIFVFSIQTLGVVQARTENPAVTVEVDGFQWQWTFRYLDGDQDPDNDYSVTGSAAQPPSMVLPVGVPVRLLLRSLDVIHSFYVPNFLIKRDLVPVPEGQPENELEITIDRVGIYAGQCAEFCGNAHANMTFTIDARSEADYATWLEGAKSGEPPPAPSAPADATVVELDAAGFAFDTDRIEVPAGEPVVIRFTNDDVAVHDVAVFEDQTEVFNGEDLAGGSSVDYQVPALEAGEYDFLCTIHPNMNGTLVAQ